MDVSAIEIMEVLVRLSMPEQLGELLQHIKVKEDSDQQSLKEQLSRLLTNWFALKNRKLRRNRCQLLTILANDCYGAFLHFILETTIQLVGF